MSGPKKHPLEIFRSSGRKFGDTGHPLPADGDANKETPAEDSPLPPDVPAPRGDGPPPRVPSFAQVRRERAVDEFELRLTLPGIATLAVVWLLLLGGAYLYGYRRGEGATQQQHDAQALANGKQIEEGGDSGAPQAPAEANNADAALPFGVTVATYNRDQDALLEETQRTLTERYGIDVLNVYRYDDTGKQLLVAGVFASKDDPGLKALEVKLHNIKDYPRGDKSPFRRALISRHPNLPYFVPADYTGPRHSQTKDN